jgi:NADH-quinone oxidoreductase subunit J
MIYIGAIVVLFLFVIMMLDIKSNIIQKTSLTQTSFSFNNLILIGLFVIFSLLILQEIPLIDLLNSKDIYKLTEFSFTYWIEYFNFFEIFQSFTTINHIQLIGQSMYRYFLYSFLLGGVILLISMIGAIVLTVDEHSNYRIKMQNASIQTMKQPSLRYVFFS